jgi:hypothetical protein
MEKATMMIKEEATMMTEATMDAKIIEIAMIITPALMMFVILILDYVKTPQEIVVTTTNVLTIIVIMVTATTRK